MKLKLSLIIGILLFMQCTAPDNNHTQQSPTEKIRVGVFDGHGGAQTCIWETVAAVKIDPEMDVRTITSADISSGILETLDAIIIPGGSGSRQFLNLGEQNRERIKEFVAKGGGAVGICAGAYFFSSTPSYASIGINGEKAIDIEHDNRGHGLAKFTLNEEGGKIFPELTDKDTCYVIYYEGPVFVKNTADTIKNTILAVMQSDVHEEGDAPANMTNGKSFFVSNKYGKGKVFSTIAHPEATAGMMWMIPRMVRWTLDKPIISYKQGVVLPDLYNKEFLMSVDNIKKESESLQTLLYGTPEQKTEALDWLESCHSWEAKRWVQGLLYDSSPNVRIRAAKYIANSHYLPYLEDLRAAYNSEKEMTVKEELKKQLDKLEGLLP